MIDTSENRAALPVASGRVVAAWLWQELRGKRLRVMGVLALFLAEAAAALIFPVILGFLVDTVAAGVSTGGGSAGGGSGSGQVPAQFWWQLVGLGAAAVASGLLAWAGGAALAKLSETLIAQLREAYVKAALNLPRSTVEAAGSGDLVTRASDDISEISTTLPHVLPRAAVSAFTVLLVATGLGAMNLWFLVGWALTIPGYALTLMWYLRTAPPVYACDRVAQSRRGQRILGTLTQMPTVSAHRLETRTLGQIESATWETVRWSMRTRIIQNRLFGRLNVIEAIGLLTVLGVGVWLASRGLVSTGEATAAALLFLRTVAPIRALMYVMDDMQLALASLGRLVGVIADVGDGAGGEVARAGGVARAGVGGGEAARAGGVARAGTDAVVALESVHFSYRGDTPVLQDVTLELRAEEVTAVVGATGSGKSTLASLIAGVHDPLRGELRRNVPASRVMTVSQETHVFAGTLRENLSLAAPDASDVELVKALRQTGAQHLLDELQDGLDTVVGSAGHQLSPAHAQHLALARLALAEPELVILDEATAEADSVDTAVLDQGAEEVIRGRAALIIAHRLSQAAAADRVVVLEAGRIVEVGPHDQLVVAGGPYAQLWQAWSENRQLG
ncbi:MAG: ABC transporter ATP-binding protein [Ancrocorticia sp.]